MEYKIYRNQKHPMKLILFYIILYYYKCNLKNVSAVFCYYYYYYYYSILLIVQYIQLQIKDELVS